MQHTVMMNLPAGGLCMGDKRQVLKTVKISLKV